MAVTVAQVRAGKAVLLDRLFLRYPETRIQTLRVLAQYWKQGDATEREVAQEIFRQAYQAISGRASLDHQARHWLQDALQQQDDSRTTGLALTDEAIILEGIG